MNILADELANRSMQETGRREKIRPTFKNSVISIYDKDNRYITDMRKYMVEKVNGKRIIDYYKNRRGWTEEVIENIEWEGINGMLRYATPLRRIKLVKMLHHWQNTGRQKGKIRDSRLKLESDRPKHPTVEEESCHLCPDSCGEEEGNLHYLHCPKKKAIEDRDNLIRKVNRRLRLLRTSEQIMGIIGQVLKIISRRGVIKFDLNEFKVEANSKLAKAIEGQGKIGWHDMCQGYQHKAWAKAQDIYYKYLGINTKYMNIGRWKRMVSTILGEYCLDCWERRNKIIHGDNVTESRTKKLVRLRKQVSKLYRMKDELKGTPNKGIFDLPQEKRKKMGIQSTKIWIGMAEEVLRLHRENAIKYTIHQWLQPR